MSKRKYLHRVLYLLLFLLLFSLSAVCVNANDKYSDASVNSENATVLTEGTSARCTLTPANNNMTAFRLAPKESGYYIFFSGGEEKGIDATLYEGVGDTDGLNYVTSNNDDNGGFVFVKELNAGQTYTLLVKGCVEDVNSVFDVGFVKKDSGKLTPSASQITLTDDHNGYKFCVCSGNEIPDAEWIYSDESVLGSGYSYSTSVGDPSDTGYCNVCGVFLTAKKSGTSTVSLVDRNDKTKVYATCTVTCKDITEYYDIYVGGVRVNNRNASNITGEGISGKVSYDLATNTLTLSNATLSVARRSNGLVRKLDVNSSSGAKGTRKGGNPSEEWGDFTGVINNHSEKTLKVRLAGTNKITNAGKVLSEDGGALNDNSLWYSGVEGISSCGSVEFSGTGSLTIDGSYIGNAIYSNQSVTVAEGTTLNIKETNNNNARGIIADKSVVVNGTLKDDVRTSLFVVDGQKACTEGYCIITEKLVVGKKGSAVLNASTNCDATSYCVQLDSDGSAEVSGTLNAKAVGGDGESAGIAIKSRNSGANLKVTGTGKATLQGNKSALEDINFVTPVLVKAGSSASDVETISPSRYNGEKYVVVSVPGACAGGHALVRVAAKEPTEDEQGNIEYWICNDCGKLFRDAEGKTEIAVEDTLLPRLASNLWIIAPNDGEVFDVGATVTVAASSNIFMFTYIGGFLIEGAPNYIYVRAIKDGTVVASDTLAYTEPDQRVSTSFVAATSGIYTIEVSKHSDFSSIRSVKIQVGSVQPDEGGDTPSGGGTDNPQSPSSPSTSENQPGEDGTAVGTGASYATAEKEITEMRSDADPAGSKFSPLKLRSAKQKKNSVTLGWSSAPGAAKYVVYGNKCGKKNTMQKIVMMSGKKVAVNKIAGKKLKKGTYYKFIVVALDNNNNVVSTSKVIHVATKGGKAGNPTKLTIKAPKKSKAKLKVGKSVKIKAVQAGPKKQKVKKHASLRYESSNMSVATVTKTGKVKAVGKGSCKIFVYAQNGLSKTIKITVK